MRVSRRVRVVLSAICWISAVVSATLTAAAFAGAGTSCQAGQRTTCAPQTWLLGVGIALTLGLGVLAASLHKPRHKREGRYPWQYPR